MVAIYHAPNARSLRVLWVLEELAVKADVKTLPFPPRRLQPEYLFVNPAGTVPAMVDGDLVMTESLAICEYLAAKHGSTSLIVAPGDPERAPYLQWLWYGESTIMLPIGLISRVRRPTPSWPTGAKPLRLDSGRWSSGSRAATSWSPADSPWPTSRLVMPCTSRRSSVSAGCSARASLPTMSACVHGRPSRRQQPVTS
jgi:glutathione S-transferase